ncbi:MAG: hypothetical protein GY851_12215 [bacterium]|nr:hypothetical protein [bacterium]
MRRFWRQLGIVLLTGVGALVLVGHVTAQETAPAGAASADTALAPLLDSSDSVMICHIEGMIDDGILVLVERAIRDATAEGSKAIIFVVDTPGGRVDSCIKITDVILKAPCPTIAFIDGMGAVSAGAVISLSCDTIYMTEATVIGASQPVIPSAEGMLPTGEKEVSFLRATIAAIAEANDHNPHLARAMVDKDIELIAYPRGDGTYDVVERGSVEAIARDGDTPAADDPLDEALDEMTKDMPDPLKAPVKDLARELVRQAEEAIDDVTEGGLKPSEPVSVNPDGSMIILARGKLLTLTPSEAVKYRLIPTTVRTVDQAMSLEGYLGARKVELVPTWSEELFRFLISPTVAGILLMLGIGGLYFEVKTPGFGIPGIIALVCFALFFGARAFIGLSEWIEPLLIILGIGLILIEIFVLPGFGIAGIAGILCLIAGIYLSFTFDDFSIPRYSWQFDRIDDAMRTLAIAGVSFAVFAFAFWKVFPHTPLYGKIVLLHAQDAENGYVVQDDMDGLAAVGMVGVATSPLRPAGRGRFKNKTCPVVSRAEFIEKGTPVVVVQVDGNRYVVDPIDRIDDNKEKA